MTTMTTPPDAGRAAPADPTTVDLVHAPGPGRPLHELTRPIVDAPTAREALGALCDALGAVLAVDDLAVTLGGVDEPVLRLATTRRASRAVSIQRELGAGPHVTAGARGMVVVVDDLGSASRWPRVAAALRREGARAVAAVPLTFNGHHLGCASAYATVARAFGSAEVHAACRLADTAAADLCYRHRALLDGVVDFRTSRVTV